MTKAKKINQFECKCCGEIINQDSDFDGEVRFGNEGGEKAAFCSTKCAADWYAGEVSDFDELREFMKK